jgi:hypothetical protein
VSAPTPSPETPPKLVWPKYALIAVSLFFTVCIVWTYKEVSRLKKAKAEGGAVPPTSTLPDSVRTNTVPRP